MPLADPTPAGSFQSHQSPSPGLVSGSQPSLTSEIQGWTQLAPENTDSDDEIGESRLESHYQGLQGGCEQEHPFAGVMGAAELGVFPGHC